MSGDKKRNGNDRDVGDEHKGISKKTFVQRSSRKSNTTTLNLLLSTLSPQSSLLVSKSGLRSGDAEIKTRTVFPLLCHKEGKETHKCKRDVLPKDWHLSQLSYFRCRLVFPTRKQTAENCPGRKTCWDGTQCTCSLNRQSVCFPCVFKVSLLLLCFINFTLEGAGDN